MVIAAAVTAADADGTAMNREDAEREAARRNREQTAACHRWFARADADDEWSLVKVAGVPGARVHPLKGTVEAKPKPSPADDPRPNVWRDVGGPWSG